MVDASIYAKFEDLSPFEIKDELFRLAQVDKAGKTYLNAGRGNPNWIATRGREAFFLLGQFALTEKKRTFLNAGAGLAGMPPRNGCYDRLKAWVLTHKSAPDTPGADTPEAAVDFSNLPDESYSAIGRGIRAFARGYFQAYRAAQGEGAALAIFDRDLPTSGPSWSGEN